MTAPDWLRRTWPAWVVAALVVVVFADPLLTSRVFFYRDLGSAVHPVLEEARVAEDGRTVLLPPWSHAISSGRTLVANPGYALLHPTSALYLVLPFDVAFDAFLVVQVIVGALGMVALCAALGLSRTAALGGSLAFAFGGGTFSALNLYPSAVGMGWAPLVLAAGVLVAQSPTVTRLALLALAIGLQGLGGSPETILATIVAGGVLSLATTDGRLVNRLARTAWTWAAAGLWGLALAAPQIVPGVAASKVTLRAVGFNAHGVLYNSLDPRALPGLLVPRWGGHPMESLQGGFPGAAWTDTGTPYLVSVYLGASVAVLGIVACVVAIRARAGRALPLALAGLVALTVLVALGRHVPGVASLLERFDASLPLRYPAKALYAAGPAAPLLGALGLEAVRRRFGPAVALLVALVVGLDLVTAHRGFAPTIAAAALDAPALAHELRARSEPLAAPHSWRVHHQRLPQGGWEPPREARPATIQDEHLWRRRMLIPPTAAAHGVASAMEPTGDLLDDLGYFTIAKTAYRAEPAEWARTLGQASVLWVVARDGGLEASTGGVLELERPIGAQDGIPAGSGWLYRNAAFVPRAVLSSRPDWPVAPESVVAGKARITVQDPGGLELEVTSPTEAWLVLTDSLGRFDDWRAHVGTERVTIERAGPAFAAVPVPVGSHVVRLEYRPRTLIPSAALALLAALAAFAVLTLARAREVVSEGEAG